MVPPARISASMSVAGRAGVGRQRRRMEGWKNSASACWSGGDGVAGRAFVAVQGPAEQTVPQGCGLRVGAQDLLGPHVVSGVGDPLEDVIEGRLGECGGVEVGLEDLGALAGVEPGSLVAGLGGGAADRSGCEGARPSFGEHRVLTPGDGVPDESRGAGGEVEGVEDRDRSIGLLLACVQGEEEIVGFGEGDQGGAGGVEQCRGEKVQGLPGALRADDTAGAVIGDPERGPAPARGPEPPADLGGPHHDPSRVPRRSGRRRSGRIAPARRRRAASPKARRASRTVPRPVCDPTAPRPCALTEGEAREEYLSGQRHDHGENTQDRQRPVSREGPGVSSREADSVLAAHDAEQRGDGVGRPGEVTGPGEDHDALGGQGRECEDRKCRRGGNSRPARATAASGRGGGPATCRS